MTCIHIHMTKILMSNYGKAGRAEEQTQRAIRLFGPACIDGGLPRSYPQRVQILDASFVSQVSPRSGVEGR